MTEAERPTPLRRMLRPAVPPDGAGGSAVGPMTPTRALRTTLARAAEASIGLSVTVLGITEEEMGLDDLIAQLTEAQCLIAVRGRLGPVGLFAADAGLRSVAIEWQTMGRLSAARPEPRPVTRTDAALLAPLVARFLSDLPGACEGTALAGWATGLDLADPIDAPRTVGLMFEDMAYRLVRLSIDVGLSDRQGELVLALPVTRSQALPEIEDEGDPSGWSDRLRRSLMGAPADLTAVLHRLRLPLRVVERFEVGQILSLPGVTVSSVRLTGPGQTVVAQGRLGQATGLRAIRIEAEAPPEMSESRMGQGAPATRPAGAAPNSMPEDRFPASLGLVGVED